MSEPHLSEKSIFESAIDKSTPQERAAHIDKACGGNLELRQEVEALLAAHDRLGCLPKAIPDPGVTVAQLTRNDLLGTAIGPYKLLQQIGEGGMGTVFMAEQTHPVRRRVALKLIKAGMDSRQVIARFESERQALAMMDHVNIARALDAGTTESGLPYFVMELVHGVPISKYCNDNQLTPRQRLELFVPVCRAIQHAHQKGIIHRDIKPTNVMITLYDGKPVPKVIDFGVAKATEQKLTERTLFTQYGTMVGTLEHMSPEQAEMSGLGVDTRSDIYSLGVLLYELLTGSTPLNQKRVREIAYAEILRLIKEEEPPKPSTRLSDSGDALASISAQRHMEPAKLAKLLRGELDWIVMKALEKDRNRRYESASAFAADVERYLTDEAVQACPPSAWYRGRKFARRNKAKLAFATVVLLFIVSLGVGIGWTTRDRAARRAETGRQVRDSLASARTLLGENKPAQARQKLAEAKVRLGQDKAGLGALASEVDAFDTELARFERFFALIERANEAQAPAGGSLLVMSGGRSSGVTNTSPIDVHGWKPGGEVPSLLEALALYAVLDRDDWSSRLDRNGLEREQIAQVRGAAYEALLVLAGDMILRQVDHRSGQKITGEAAARQTFVYLQKAEAAHTPTSQFYVTRCECWRVLRNEEAAHADEQLALTTPATLALDHYQSGLWAYYAKNGPDAVKEFEAALRLEPTHYWSLMWLGFALSDLGEVKDSEGAAVAFTGCIARRPEHSHAYYCRGLTYLALHRHEEALADLSKAIELDPKFAASWSSRGAAYGNLHQHDKAVADATKALELNPELAPAWNIRGAAYYGLGQFDKAVADLNKAIELGPTFADSWHHRGKVYGSLRRYDQAIADLTKAIELDPKDAGIWADRGEAYDNSAQPDKALADLNKAIELDPKPAGPWVNRGVVYGNLGQADKAVADYSKAIELDPKLAAAWSNRGAVRIDEGQIDGAVADLNKAIELDAKCTAAWSNRGSAHVKQGKMESASADFAKAIELDPGCAPAWMGRGQMYEVSGQMDRAIIEYSKAIELDPKFALAWSNRGGVYEALGQRDNALADLQKSLELDPTFARAWASRGVTYIGMSMPEKAIADLNKAIELDAKFALAWSNRGVAYDMLGQADKAIADFSKAIELDPKLINASRALANLLTTCPDIKLRKPARAVDLLRNVLELQPKDGASLQTLGWALYRTGAWRDSIESFRKSMALQDDPKGGDPGQWFGLAMAHWQAGNKDEARKWYDQAVQWMEKNAPKDESFLQYRAEAEELLKIEKKATPK